ncbi:enoyl-CoA hydratase/isomerase family protein [Verminephrobacter eiseniae]|uniref:enoyl-CoA hydratase/isomerase family protein n=1 Tax=Verminephrobacter eiseniae TaxID=364317 RepID=UPI0022387CBA|nr:enoyl-CoA hydratase-related protein [Verminephrobacter eiseniae]MCW5233043.1 enoyl-CoA hydratase [Verminephrobacter eiseniae]MCW5295401.1 enoyl-CoA hydratase [Verminephrobacter eiseniae]MCW8186818.1 enoyl-CoA hydratase [Verminephrobacter eiseniae]MCW8222962.1 enoyl-CoA hydratase [Verminephrobacter eiseniae]MCW8233164.1 enoyl-CoA hydratase [Verminephrobacter eiseniae]
MIELARDEEFAVLTIRRPAALNALSFDLLGKIGPCIRQAGQSGARALIVTGEGDKAFCAGADIKELQNRELQAQREGAESGQAVFALLDRLPIPSVALVNGFAFGGGCELALACTLRLALPNARFGLPEVKLGLIPGYGGTQRLPRLVGLGRALELVLTGRTVDAPEALAIGLVNRVVQPPGLAAAKAYARQFSGHGLRALQFAREAVLRAADMPLHDGLRMEADLSTLAYRTRDAQEGLQAFVDKRPPKPADC